MEALLSHLPWLGASKNVVLPDFRRLPNSSLLRIVASLVVLFPYLLALLRFTVVID